MTHWRFRHVALLSNYGDRNCELRKYLHVFIVWVINISQSSLNEADKAWKIYTNSGNMLYSRIISLSLKPERAVSYWQIKFNHWKPYQINWRFSSFDLVAFRAYHRWAWVPVIACLLGGVLGAIVYIITIEVHHKAPEDVDNPYRPVSGTDASEDQLWTLNQIRL